ncbi:MAG: hypothetical protein ABSG07_21020 [Terriglobales bacterium]|jgi:hypothetical protein
MDRWLAVLLLAGCATLQASAQAPSEPTPQTPDNHAAVPASPAEQAAATTPAQSEFPLDKFKEFSAIMTGGPVPGNNWDGHIYRSGNLMRMQGPVGNYFITDLAKKETHGIAPPGCLKISYVYSRSFPFSVPQPGMTYQHVPVGEETVDGHACRVEDIIFTDPKNHNSTHTLRFWEAEDLQGFPVKVELRPKNGAPPPEMHYKNVVLGPQDPTLFIVPNQCQSSADITSPKKASPAPTPKKAPAGSSQ